ncbi:uncharacterized protein LOC121681287 isoform X5 [Alosa sapidissima]|uniref:uncharacterized protein LOC121681287 isoform X5 n=1 Tax=Alosa sapidissima TaxID=34773 RepID=UPI001C097019|nr:uncharacterized protein LOC121681287 isoform X5 [Alosa sapidissima]
MCVLLPQMRAFAGFVVLLVTSTYGLDSMCDATQDAACYGALGGPVYLQLMRNTRGHDLSLNYNSKHVFKFRKSKSVFYEEFNTTSVLQRWKFVPDNGTMIINPAERRDAGTYRVEITESTGRVVKHTVQLTIEATMTPTTTAPTTISSAAMTTNNGVPMATTPPPTPTSTTSALLCVCSSGGISPVFISVWLAEIIILTSLLVGGYYLYIRNRTSHTPDERKDQEVELTLTSTSRRRRTPEKVQMQ